MDQKERINPMRMHRTDTQESFVLDFNRDAIRFAEDREFIIDDVIKYPQTKVPELFFYAFRFHHKGMSRSQTDALLDEKGGLTPAELERLVLLYRQAQMANVLKEESDEDSQKNAVVTVELD